MKQVGQVDKPKILRSDKTRRTCAEAQIVLSLAASVEFVGQEEQQRFVHAQRGNVGFGQDRIDCLMPCDSIQGVS